MTTRLPDPVYRLFGRFGRNRVVRRLHPIAYRLLRGHGPVGRQFGVRNVVLTTTGARSGRPREVPLYAFEDGPRTVVVASNGGHDRAPAWLANLRAHPEARLLVGDRATIVRAREAQGEERSRLWTLVSAAYPGYLAYQAGTAREIALVVLEPAEG